MIQLERSDTENVCRRNLTFPMKVTRNKNSNNKQNERKAIDKLLRPFILSKRTHHLPKEHLSM